MLYKHRIKLEDEPLNDNFNDSINNLIENEDLRKSSNDESVKNDENKNDLLANKQDENESIKNEEGGENFAANLIGNEEGQDDLNKDKQDKNELSENNEEEKMPIDEVTIRREYLEKIKNSENTHILISNVEILNNI